MYEDPNSEFGDAGEYYEPSEEEKRDIEEILNQESRKSEITNRLTYTYNSESHWIGWLRIHGIIW